MAVVVRNAKVLRGFVALAGMACAVGLPSRAATITDSSPAFIPRSAIRHARPGDRKASSPVVSTVATWVGLTPAAVKRVKAATVFIRVDASDGESQGTGFFALAPGLVLTNAHVVAPEEGASKEVRVVIRSGSSSERVVRGRVLAADHECDLAVVRVSGTKLPEPLPFSRAVGLTETMPLYVFGFPFGDGLAARGRNPEPSVLRASVACLRHNASGRLDMIQLDGELQPGNSGGPVLDPWGRVVGITVSRLRSTRIGFAIPGERLNDLIPRDIRRARKAEMASPTASLTPQGVWRPRLAKADDRAPSGRP